MQDLGQNVTGQLAGQAGTQYLDFASWLLLRECYIRTLLFVVCLLLVHKIKHFIEVAFFQFSFVPAVEKHCNKFTFIRKEPT